MIGFPFLKVINVVKDFANKHVTLLKLQKFKILKIFYKGTQPAFIRL